MHRGRQINTARCTDWWLFSIVATGCNLPDDWSHRAPHPDWLPHLTPGTDDGKTSTKISMWTMWTLYLHIYVFLINIFGYMPTWIIFFQILQNSATIRAGSKCSSNPWSQPGLRDLDRLPSWVDLGCLVPGDLVTWLDIKNSKGLWFTWGKWGKHQATHLCFGVNCKHTILYLFLIKI